MTVNTRALLVTAALLLASTACVHGALTATQIVDAINGMTARTGQLQYDMDTKIFTGGSTGTTPTGFGVEPMIVRGLQDVTALAKAFTDQLSNPPGVRSTFDVPATAAAFSSFVQAHKQVIKTIVNSSVTKSGGVAATVRDALAQEDPALNAVAFSVAVNLGGAAGTQVSNDWTILHRYIMVAKGVWAAAI